MSRPSLKIVAIAGAAAGLIGFGALQTSQPQTQSHAVALTVGDTEIFLPASTLDVTVASGYPPLIDILQGTDTWQLTDASTGYGIVLDGTDVHTTFGSFTNDDFLETDGQEGLPVGGNFIPLPSAGSEIDLANFGGGFENEWIHGVDGLNNDAPIYSDTIITPFGNYTIPLGSTTAEPFASAASTAPADAFSGVLESVQASTAAAQEAFSSAGTAFTEGEYAFALSETLSGFNNLTVGVAGDVLLNGYYGLTGDTGITTEFILINPSQPADLADGLASAHDFLAQAQGLVSELATDFSSGVSAAGLTDLTGIGIDSTYATDAIILGLFDSLVGTGAGL